jgi:acyl-CoA reductase-like NAD-dependent aldehyde dehydrogenase
MIRVQAAPHGGWKKSGFGRFNGFEGIREFTQTKVGVFPMSLVRRSEDDWND